MSGRRKTIGYHPEVDARERKDRLVGCIVGGAIGDAMGGPFEGRPGPVAPDPDAPWILSDDTQLTLATCEAIGEGGVVTPEAVADRFLDWFRHQRITGAGASTLEALRNLDVGAHWSISGRQGAMAAGNGAAMRIAPLAFCLDPDDEEDRATLRDICRITHHNDEAYVGALAIARAIRAMTSNTSAPGDGLLPRIAATLPDTSVRDRMLTVGRLPGDTPPAVVAARHGCSGFVVDSVPRAIFTAQRADRLAFPELLEEVIAGGGDTDTIASMTGQIVGARLGQSRLPAALLGKFRSSDLVSIVDTATELAHRLSIAAPLPPR